MGWIHKRWFLFTWLTKMFLQRHKLSYQVILCFEGFCLMCTCMSFRTSVPIDLLIAISNLVSVQNTLQYKNHFHNYVITYGDKGHKCRWHHTRYPYEANKKENDQSTNYTFSTKLVSKHEMNSNGPWQFILKPKQFNLFAENALNGLGWYWNSKNKSIVGIWNAT